MGLGLCTFFLFSARLMPISTTARAIFPKLGTHDLTGWGSESEVKLLMTEASRGNDASEEAGVTKIEAASVPVPVVNEGVGVTRPSAEPVLTSVEVDSLRLS